MHPYEMQQLMRERGHRYALRLKGSSLYSTVERLTAAGLVEPLETTREGKRPERTVYRITESGEDELLSWMQDLLADPIDEFPWFGAILAFLAALPPDEVLKLLDRRVIALSAAVAASRSVLEAVQQFGLPRVLSVETEYAQAQRESELRWVQHLADDIRNGTLDWDTEELKRLAGGQDQFAPPTQEVNL
jgi:DNA-binding PadR family transcriptional regulator